MTEPFDPAKHRLAESGYFEDFAPGETFYIPSRTVTEAQFLAFPMQLDVEPAGAQELDLRRLHEAEEVGEMDNAGHVGVAELDAAFGLEQSDS